MPRRFTELFQSSWGIVVFVFLCLIILVSLLDCIPAIEGYWFSVITIIFTIAIMFILIFGLRTMCHKSCFQSIQESEGESL